jgi:hypothetical protein
MAASPATGISLSRPRTACIVSPTPKCWTSFPRGNSGACKWYALGFFNDTPLQNPDGSYNFQGAKVDFRSGTQLQDPIDGFPDVSNEIAVGVELKSSTPWAKTLTNTQLTSVSIRLV